jgi:hypothetical protein
MCSWCGVNRYGYVWPPPTTSSRLLVSTMRERKPSAHVIEQERKAQARELEAAQAAADKVARAEQRQRRKLEKDAAASTHAAEKAIQRAAEAAETKRKAAASLARKSAQAVVKLKAAKKMETLNKANEIESPSVATLCSSAVTSEETGAVGQAVPPPSSTKHPLKAQSGAGRRGKRRRVREWAKCAKCTRKHWSDAICHTLDNDEDSDANVPPVMAKRWTGNTTAALLMSLKAKVSTTNGLADTDRGPGSVPPQNPVNPLGMLIDAAAVTSPSPIVTETNSTLTSAANLTNSKASVDIGAVTMLTETEPSAEDRPSSGDLKSADTSIGCSAAAPQSLPLCSTTVGSPKPSPTKSHPDVLMAYQIIKSKVDITSGGDGYGMTGNCTQASMAKLLEVLQIKYELGRDAWFMDLGHGMGR